MNLAAYVNETNKLVNCQLCFKGKQKRYLL